MLTQLRQGQRKENIECLANTNRAEGLKGKRTIKGRQQ